MNRDYLAYTAVVSFLFALVCACNHRPWLCLAGVLLAIAMAFLYLICVIADFIQAMEMDHNSESPRPRLQRCTTCDSAAVHHRTPDGWPFCDECWSTYLITHREGP